ncbi:MAG: hypothetical protein ACLUAM_08660 [Bifidobacterium adolescentis]
MLEQEEGSGAAAATTTRTLPLASDKDVTLFGHAVVQPVYSPGGANSAADIGKYVIDLKSALEHAGFSVNNTFCLTPIRRAIPSVWPATTCRFPAIHVRMAR